MIAQRGVGCHRPASAPGGARRRPQGTLLRWGGAILVGANFPDDARLRPRPVHIVHQVAGQFLGVEFAHHRRVGSIHVEPAAGHDVYACSAGDPGQGIEVAAVSTQGRHVHDGRSAGSLEESQFLNGHVFVIQEVGRPAAGAKDVTDHVFVHRRDPQLGSRNRPQNSHHLIRHRPAPFA